MIVSVGLTIRGSLRSSTRTSPEAHHSTTHSNLLESGVVKARRPRVPAHHLFFGHRSAEPTQAASIGRSLIWVGAWRKPLVPRRGG
jgi:hypothetical protein